MRRWGRRRHCGWQAALSSACSREERPSVRWRRQRGEDPGLGEGAATRPSPWRGAGVGGLGQAGRPHPRTARCVSWTRIQGNCASPHSVCSEANAFLAYCLRWRLVVGTPFTSSLGERPRCSESGCGRPTVPGRERGGRWEHPRAPQGQVPGAWACCPRRAPDGAGGLLGMPPRGEGRRVLTEGPTGLPSWVGGKGALETTAPPLPGEERGLTGAHPDLAAHRQHDFGL